ncbi:unnamed protein product, partial [marine sediment metagenome]
MFDSEIGEDSIHGRAPAEEKNEPDIGTTDNLRGMTQADDSIRADDIEENAGEMGSSSTIKPGASFRAAFALPRRAEKDSFAVGSTTVFRGKIRTAGDIRIDGIYEGSIETRGDLTFGPTASFRGRIQVSGNIYIDGIYEGEIETTGDLVIGEQAKVLSDIAAHSVAIAGAVKGDINAQRVEVLETGHIWG